VLLSGSVVLLLNVFNGTIWSDEAVNSVGSHVFVNDFTAPVLRPVGSLDSIVGDENEVNGNWSLLIQLAQPGVVLESWILNFNRKKIPFFPRGALISLTDWLIFYCLFLYVKLWDVQKWDSVSMGVNALLVVLEILRV